MISREELHRRLDKLKVVVYCGSWLCRTSDRVHAKLRALGYIDVQVYRGGAADWRLNHLPIVRST